MLIECPECSREVSNYACNCPCCGFPVNKYKDIPNSNEKYIDYFLSEIHDFILYTIPDSNGAAKPNWPKFKAGERCSVRINSSENSSMYLVFQYLDDNYQDDYHQNCLQQVRINLDILDGCSNECSITIKDLIISFRDRFEYSLPMELESFKNLIKGLSSLNEISVFFLKDYLDWECDDYDEDHWIGIDLNSLMIRDYFKRIRNKASFLLSCFEDIDSRKLSNFFAIGTHSEKVYRSGSIFADIHIHNEPEFFKNDIDILQKIIKIIDENLLAHGIDPTFEAGVDNLIFHYNETFMNACNNKMRKIINLSGGIKHKVFCTRLGVINLNIFDYAQAIYKTAPELINDRKIAQDLKSLGDVENLYLNFVRKDSAATPEFLN